MAEDFGDGFGFGDDEPTGFGGDNAGPEQPAVASGHDAGNGSAAQAGEEQASEPGPGVEVGHGQDVKTNRSGWLTTVEPKKTLSRKGGSKERWFSLADGKLSYAASVRQEPIEVFNLAEITSVDEAPGQDDCFTIVTKKKQLFVRSRDAADAALWIASLRKAHKSVAASEFGGGASANALLF
jgi:hypothetical protein